MKCVMCSAHCAMLGAGVLRDVLGAGVLRGVRAAGALHDARCRCGCAVWVRSARTEGALRCSVQVHCAVRAADWSARFNRGAVCSRSALLRYWLRESPFIHRYCRLSPCPKTRSALPFPLCRINHNSRRLFFASYTPALRCLPPTQKHRFTRSGETVL